MGSSMSSQAQWDRYVALPYLLVRSFGLTNVLLVVCSQALKIKEQQAAVEKINDCAKALKFDWARPIADQNEKAWDEWQEAAAKRAAK